MVATTPLPSLEIEVSKFVSICTYIYLFIYRWVYDPVDWYVQEVKSIHIGDSVNLSIYLYFCISIYPYWWFCKSIYLGVPDPDGRDWYEQEAESWGDDHDEGGRNKAGTVFFWLNHFFMEWCAESVLYHKGSFFFT